MFRDSHRRQSARLFRFSSLAVLLLLGVGNVLAQPANNNFANAQVLTGNTGNVNGNSTGATAEAGEPQHGGINAHHSVWYRWTAPFAGRATFIVNSNFFTPVVAIYTGTAVNALTRTANDTNPAATLPLPSGCCGSAVVGFTAVAGTVYRIAVDGRAATAFGEFNLRFGPGRTLSGNLTDLAGRVPDANNPHLSLTGDVNRVVPAAAPNGSFSFTVIQGNNYHLEPATVDFVGFDPFDRDFQPLNNDIANANFVARTPVYNIAGRITDNNGAALGNLALRVSQNGTVTANEIRTAADGTYSFNNCIVYNDYEIIPVPANNLAFTPASRNYARIKGNFLNQNYSGNRLTVATVSAASFTNAVATESIAALFGANLATSSCGATGATLPTTLCGASIRLRDRAGTERLAPLFFVGPSQINYQIAPGLLSGQTTVTVTTGGGATLTGAVQVDAVAPGLFAANADGQGVAAAVALRIRNGGQTFEDAVRFDQAQQRFVAVPIDLGPAGDQVFLLLFGTGIRFRTAQSAVGVRIGGGDASINFAGAQGQLIGVDQVNALIPRTLSGRGEVDVTLTADGKAANVVRVNIR